jgi:hypothetical protein
MAAMNPAMTKCLVSVAVAAALSVAAVPSVAAAAEKRCGSLGSAAPDYRDIRAESTSCVTARRLVRAFVRARSRCGNVLDRCRVFHFTCGGRLSDRLIAESPTYRVNCRRREARVRWWITVFH